MARNYTKQQVEFMNAAGLLLDPDAGCYFGRRGEYSMLLRLISKEYVLQREIRADSDKQLRIVVPDWDKLRRDGVFELPSLQTGARIRNNTDQ